VPYGLFYPRKGVDVATYIKILLDSGASSAVLSAKLAKKLKKKITKPQEWTTKGGNFTTNCMVKMRLCLPELDESKVINYDVHVDESEEGGRCDLIIGRDLLKQLSIILDFNDDVIKSTDGPYMGCSAPMKDSDAIFQCRNSHFVDELYESDTVREATERASRIQAANYHKADLKQVCDNATHLSILERTRLHALLTKYEFLFDGTLGAWNTEPVNLEL